VPDRNMASKLIAKTGSAYMSSKKIIKNAILDVFVVILCIAFAIVSNYILHDNIKCTCMIILAAAWGIRTVIHLTKMLEVSNDDHNEDK